MRRRLRFPSFCKASTAAEPGKCALDDPAPRQNFEALGGIGPFDDLDGPTAMTSHLVAQFWPGVAAVGEDMARPWIALTYPLKHIYSAVPVLNIGRMNHDEDQNAAGVGEDMALSTLDLLICVIAANSATFRYFNRMAIDHAGAG